LKFDLLKLLSQAFLLVLLYFFLSRYFFIYLVESFLSRSYLSCFTCSCVFFLLFPSLIGLYFSLFSRFFNFFGIVYQYKRIFFLLSQILFALQVDFLLEFTFIQFQSFPKFSNRTLNHKTMISCFSWIKALSPLDRDLF
jgi:hypothetical protein